MGTGAIPFFNAGAGVGAIPGVQGDWSLAVHVWRILSEGRARLGVPWPVALEPGVGPLGSGDGGGQWVGFQDPNRWRPVGWTDE